MTAPTSFQGGKPEALSTHGSAASPAGIHGTRAFSALESLVGLALIMLIVWLWMGKDDE